MRGFLIGVSSVFFIFKLQVDCLSVLTIETGWCRTTAMIVCQLAVEVDLNNITFVVLVVLVGNMLINCISLNCDHSLLSL